MNKVEIPKGRAIVSTQMGALEIVIPSKKNLFAMVFLPFWLCAWFFGETSAIHELLSGNAKGGGDGFLAVWLIMWTMGGGFAITALLWSLAGREILTIGNGAFVHRRAIGLLGFSRSYELFHVKDLRATPNAMAYGSTRRQDPFGMGGGTIAFDYGAKTIHVGSGVDEAEAKGLVETIRNRYRI